MSILASYIYILGYLLRHPLSKASLLVLLFLFLRVLLLYFLPLLGFFRGGGNVTALVKNNSYGRRRAHMTLT